MNNASGQSQNGQEKYFISYKAKFRDILQPQQIKKVPFI